jgi:hypothetical protein
VWRRVYYDSKESHVNRRRRQRRDVFANDDDPTHVRISRWKGQFEKGYVPNWSREQFVVTDRGTKPQRGAKRRRVYKIQDTKGEEVTGSFYPEQLQFVPAESRNVFEVEKVIKRRKAEQGGFRETLVKFRGWPDKFNRWLNDTELQRYSTPLHEQQQQHHE